jgi:hypothetical protein
MVRDRIMLILRARSSEQRAAALGTGAGSCSIRPRDTLELSSCLRAYQATSAQL